MAAKGIQFPSRWDGGTIFPNLDVIRGRSIQVVIREISVRTGVGGDPTLVADNNLHASGKVCTPWADTIVSLAESALLKEETS